MAWRLLVGILVALGAVWVAFVAFLLVARPKGWSLRDAARILPDVIRLLRRLAGDHTVPRGVCIRLWLLLGYLALPIDLVPDFLPVVGYADDVVITLVVLRSVIRRAGPDAVRRHWPGTEAGLAVLFGLTAVREPAPTRTERLNEGQSEVD